VGQGSSTVLGTLPGGCYATSVYYRLNAAERAWLRRFAVELLDAAGVPRTVSSDLEVECVRRRLPDGSWLLFLINRLSEQRGTLTLSGLAEQAGRADYTVEALYADNHSSAEVVQHHSEDHQDGSALRLALTLAKDAVLVLRLSPESV
jgi:hypothetical protein